MPYNVEITWRPLTQWPPGRERMHGAGGASHFKSRQLVNDGQSVRAVEKRVTFQTTRRELTRELAYIGVDACVVQVDIPARAGRLTLDDLVNMKSPAVVLTFTRNGAAVTMATDYFKRWQDNFRAIVKGLEALRLLERYHIANTGAQYTAWQALPATTTTTISTEQAAEIIRKRAGGAFSVEDIVTHSGIAKDLVRRARAAVHPDKHGGDTRDFQLVEDARRVLVAHHGVDL